MAASGTGVGNIDEQARTGATDSVPDELLTAFRENYQGVWRLRRRKALLLALILMAACAAIAVWISAGTSREPAKVIASKKLPLFMGGAVQLPSNRDGWERYSSGGTEYRLKWSGGSLSAIQLIPASGELTGEFITAVLKELTGVSGYSVTSREYRGGFLVETADAASGSLLIIYRDARKSGIRGVALSRGSME